MKLSKSTSTCPCFSRNWISKFRSNTTLSSCSLRANGRGKGEKEGEGRWRKGEEHRASARALLFLPADLLEGILYFLLHSALFILPSLQE